MTNWEKNGFRKFASKKVSTLLVPFVIYSLIVLLLTPLYSDKTIGAHSWQIMMKGWEGMALWFVPVLFFSQVVCYYVVAGQLASFIFKHFFHTKYISLVNLIGGREIVQELFGARFSESQIQDELGRILQDPAYQKRMLNGYDEIIHTLGMPGASKRTARLIVESLGS